MGLTATAPVTSRTPSTGRESMAARRPATSRPIISASLCAATTKLKLTSGLAARNHAVRTGSIRRRRAMRRPHATIRTTPTTATPRAARTATSTPRASSIPPMTRSMARNSGP